MVMYSHKSYELAKIEYIWGMFITDRQIEKYKNNIISVDKKWIIPNSILNYPRNQSSGLFLTFKYGYNL